MNPPSNHNPYAAPQADVSMSSPSMGELADRGTRLGAALLDGLIYVIAYIPFLAMGGLAAYISLIQDGEFPAVEGTLAIGIALSVLLALGIFAYNLVLIHKSGQTIFKKVLGIKILRQDGSRAGLGRVFWLRMVVPQLIGMIPFVGGLIGLVGILLIFRADRRCLHDIIADTIVVKC